MSTIIAQESRPQASSKLITGSSEHFSAREQPAAVVLKPYMTVCCQETTAQTGVSTLVGCQMELFCGESSPASPFLYPNRARLNRQTSFSVHQETKTTNCLSCTFEPQQGHPYMYPGPCTSLRERLTGCEPHDDVSFSPIKSSMVTGLVGLTPSVEQETTPVNPTDLALIHSVYTIYPMQNSESYVAVIACM